MSNLVGVPFKTFGGTLLWMEKRELKISNFCQARPSCHGARLVHETAHFSFKISTVHSVYYLK